MNKLLSLIGFILFATSGFSQTYSIDSATTIAKYEQVHKAGGSKIELYGKGINLVSSLYKNSKNVIEQSDKDLGQIFIMGYFKNVSSFPGGTNGVAETDVKYKCKLFFKDEKYKIIITDIYFDNFLLKQSLVGALDQRPDHFLHEAIKEADKYFVNLLSEIHTYMSKKPDSDF